MSSLAGCDFHANTFDFPCVVVHPCSALRGPYTFPFRKAKPPCYQDLTCHVHVFLLKQNAIISRRKKNMIVRGELKARTVQPAVIFDELAR